MLSKTVQQVDVSHLCCETMDRPCIFAKSVAACSPGGCPSENPEDAEDFLGLCKRGAATTICSTGVAIPGCRVENGRRVAVADMEGPGRWMRNVIGLRRAGRAKFELAVCLHATLGANHPTAGRDRTGSMTCTLCQTHALTSYVKVIVCWHCLMYRGRAAALKIPAGCLCPGSWFDAFPPRRLQ